MSEFARAMGFDDPDLLEALAAATWDERKHLRALSRAIFATAHDEGDPDRMLARLGFISGVAAAALVTIAERLE